MVTRGKENKAAQNLETALEMEVETVKEGERGGEGTLVTLGDTGLLTQETEPDGTILVYAHNGFNKTICLAILWTVQHLWPAGERFTFNCYKHWLQIILRQPGETSVTLLIREGVTQGDPLSMVLYGITLVSLVE